MGRPAIFSGPFTGEKKTLHNFAIRRGDFQHFRRSTRCRHARFVIKIRRYRGKKKSQLHNFDFAETLFSSLFGLFRRVVNFPLAMESTRECPGLLVGGLEEKNRT